MNHCYDRVLARFECLRQGREGRTWYARCPAHEDRHPSLFLFVGKKDGRLIARCRGGKGCPWREIVTASGTDPEDWFPPEMRRERRKILMPQRRIVGLYEYRDESDRLLYQVVRYDPKDFRQRRPDPSTKSGWSWDLQGVRRVLYRLPDLLKRPEAPVIIVEGEADVETLRRYRLLATTNVGGTGMGWREEYSLMLMGRRVAIIPDNDDAGRQHAAVVAGNLLLAGVASLRIVHLPGLEPRGDVTDWLEKYLRHATPAEKRAALLGQIRRAPQWQPYCEAI